MFIKRILWIAGFLSALVLGKQATASSTSINHGTPLRILPLGDSITYGYSEPSGNSYRRVLECLLWTGGNPVNLIGSVRNGDWANNQSDAFIYHTIDEILEAATPELTLNTSARPNVILLHAGTVNFVLGINVTGAPEQLGQLIDFITQHNPKTLLVVAQLIPNANATVNALIDRYNDEIPAMVAVRARAGKSVVLASMSGVTTADLLSDGTHVSELGGRAMAHSFYQAVVEAGHQGLVVPAEGPFTDSGMLSPPPSGNCADLTPLGE